MDTAVIAHDVLERQSLVTVLARQQHTYYYDPDIAV
jgi:hypothetical protein